MREFKTPQNLEIKVPQLPERIKFINLPKLSGGSTDISRRFDQRRVNLLPQVANLLTESELLRDQRISLEFAHTGVSSLVCMIEAESGRYVLKVPLSLTDGGPDEAEFLRQWQSNGVQVPQIFENGDLGEHSYTFMEFVDAPLLSQAIETSPDQAAVFFDMGKTLAKMHEPQAEGFGRRVKKKPEFASFKEWLESENIAKRVRAVNENNLLGSEHGSIPDAFNILLEYAKNHPKSSYCHFDYSPPNVFATDPITVFDPSPMVNLGIIDISRSMLSSHLTEQPDMADQLRDGYSSVNSSLEEQALHAAFILNVIWKFPHIQHNRKPEVMEKVRDYLIENRHLLH